MAFREPRYWSHYIRACGGIFEHDGVVSLMRISGVDHSVEGQAVASIGDRDSTAWNTEDEVEDPDNAFDPGRKPNNVVD
ncbi:hypothetical protein J1614_004984 [Plenodomus biglobosus]|nr:hypothetical protein J1614_004984 [Plenodomus biglobosus]